MQILRIEPGYHRLWDDFLLKISDDLSINTGYIYQLMGRNGCGKTSFIRNLLIPRLKKAGVGIIYLEQHIRLQAYAIKAHAIIAGDEMIPHTDLDIAKYLYESFAESVTVNRPLMIVCDESHAGQYLAERVKKSTFPWAFMIVSHLQVVLPINPIRWEMSITEHGKTSLKEL